MPELPDVEGFLRLFRRRAAGRRVERVEVPDRGVLRNTSPQGLGRALRGRKLERPHRHGKWLLAPTDGEPTLVFHFGMTGELAWADAGEERHPHDRVVLRVDGGELRYRDQRKLQGLWLARRAGDVERITAGQGPDALGLDREELAGRLEGRRGGLKSALMDQGVVAGLGNLLTDEVLWRARLHPTTPAGSLAGAELTRLHRALTEVLRESVKEGCVPPRRHWLTGRRDDDEPACPRCGTRLQVGRAGGRRSLWCPRCQRRRR